jgi:hypothetical protein
MSIVAAVRRISELVGDATPGGAGTRLQCLDAGHGHPVQLGAQPEGPDRAYTLEVVSVVDGGEAGCVSTRVVVTARLTVRYRLAGSRLERGAQQTADYAAIRDATVFAPSTWQHATTGLSGLQLGPSAIAPLFGAGQASATHETLTADFVLEVSP